MGNIRRLCLITGLLMICASATIAVLGDTPTILWEDKSLSPWAVALSKNGQYVVISAEGGVRFYSRGSNVSIWTYNEPDIRFSSVAISADGDSVAASSYNWTHGYVYFWKNATSSDGTCTWKSPSLWNTTDYRYLEISDDGNQLAALGTDMDEFYYVSETLYFWNNTEADGRDGNPTWQKYFAVGRGNAVALSGSGDHVVVGGIYASGYVAYWKDAKMLTGTPDPYWLRDEVGIQVNDVAISNDGESVAASTYDGPLSYWADASTLGPDPAPTWTGDQNDLNLVDISGSGDSVVAGWDDDSDGITAEVMFWDDAGGRSGAAENASWSHDFSAYLLGLVMSDSGTIVAVAVNPPSDGPSLYLFDSAGNMIWDPPFQPAADGLSADPLSISSDGRTLAVGTEMYETLYLLSQEAARTVGGVILEQSVQSISLLLVSLVPVAVVVVVRGLKRRTMFREARARDPMSD